MPAPPTRRSRMRPFEEARAFAHSLNLGSWQEWRAFAASGKRPRDIPFDPAQAYAGKGWVSMEDFIGARASRAYGHFLPYEQARDFARSLGLRTYQDWIEFAKTDERPEGIPLDPYTAYHGAGWTTVGDWLGVPTRRSRVEAPRRTVEHPTAESPRTVAAPRPKRKSRFLAFDNARKFARSLGLKTFNEWLAYTRSGSLPSNIPADPAQAYATKGWVSMGDWLGTGTVATQKREYLSFADARNFVHTLGLRNSDQWREYVRSGELPSNIPHAPEDVYKGRWRGMGDWLGTGNVANTQRTFMPFDDARKLVRKQGFQNQREFFSWKARPHDIPAAPHKAYADAGWDGYSDFLGTEGRGYRGPRKERDL